jgi:hypothetical protein
MKTQRKDFRKDQLVNKNAVNISFADPDYDLWNEMEMNVLIYLDGELALNELATRFMSVYQTQKNQFEIPVLLDDYPYDKMSVVLTDIPEKLIGKISGKTLFRPMYESLRND